MIKYLLRTKDRRLIAIYILTSLLIYGAFWFSYYLMEGKPSFYAAAGLAFAGLMLLSMRMPSKKERQLNNKNDNVNAGKDSEIHIGNSEEYLYSGSIAEVKKPKFPFIPIISIILINIGIGFTISGFFLLTKIEPSRFFGLVLLIMLGYKVAQLLLGEFFKNKLQKKGLFRTLYSVSLCLEVIGTIIVLVYAWVAAPIMWQVFYALLLCVLYSFGQLYLSRQHKKNFWDTAAISYLMGFLFVFVITIIIISAAASEGNLDISGLFDGIGSTEKKKKARISELKKSGMDIEKITGSLNDF